MNEIPHSRPLHDRADIDAATATLARQFTAAGAVAAQFAEALRVHFNGHAAASTASGTLALMSGLASLAVGPGDGVIVPTYVCPEVADAVRYVGAEPVLCDIDSDTYAPSAATVGAVIGPNTRAVVVPHMFGVPARVREIVELGLPVVEDLAQGLGARLPTGPAGTAGAVTVLSFKAIKMLSAGEGGAVVVRDAAAAERFRSLRDRNDPRRAAFDFPMSDLTAAVATSQWTRLDEFVAIRRRLAARYCHLLADLDGDECRLPALSPDRSWFRFTVELAPGIDPAAVRRAVAADGVQVRLPVDRLLHRPLGLNDANFPHAVRSFGALLSLPLYPALSDDDQARVVHSLRRALGRR